MRLTLKSLGLLTNSIWSYNMKKGRYFLNVVEEGIMNPTFRGYRGGRIEIYDTTSNSPYSMDECRFLIPEKFIDGFRDLFDFQYTDTPIKIEIDMFNYPDERKKYYGE